MKRLAGFKKKVIESWTVQRIVAVLIVVGLVVFVAGVVNKHCTCADWPNLGETLNNVISDFYANLSVDCLSVAFAILVIDGLNERRVEQDLKAQLIREMGGDNYAIAARAIRELRAHGWIEDGSLKNAELSGAKLKRGDLRSADLQHAYFIHANLQGSELNNSNLREANFVGAKLMGAVMDGASLQKARFERADLLGAYLGLANLEDTDITEQQLANVDRLRGATMPDGSRYDGRYNLVFETMHLPLHSVDPTDPEAVARFYGVSVNEYLQGQEWARENLPRLRQGVMRLLEELINNGTEPQPADASAQPAPHRNGHKASMVSHRVRR